MNTKITKDYPGCDPMSYNAKPIRRAVAADTEVMEGNVADDLVRCTDRPLAEPVLVYRDSLPVRLLNVASSISISTWIAMQLPLVAAILYYGFPELGVTFRIPNDYWAWVPFTGFVEVMLSILGLFIMILFNAAGIVLCYMAKAYSEKKAILFPPKVVRLP